MPDSSPLRIPSNFTDSSFELLAREASDREWQTSLQLPTRFPNANLISYARLLQFLLTWASRAELEWKISTFISSDAALRNFILTDHGLLSFVVRGAVLDRQGDVIPSSHPVAHPLLWERRRGMDAWDTAFRGRKLFLCAGSPSRTPPAALSPIGSKKTRSATDLSLKIGVALRQHVLGSAPIADLDQLLPKLGSTVYHLFQNATEWGCREPTGARTPVQFRLVRLSSHSIDETNAFNPTSPLFRYIAADVALTGMVVDRFLELSVLDAGPTLGAHRLSQVGLDRITASAKDHWDAMSWSLHDGNSTDRARPTPLKGRGLSLTLEDLKLIRAAVVLRSGPILAAANYAAKDAQPMLRPIMDDMPYVDGTLWSVLIPLGAK